MYSSLNPNPVLHLPVVTTYICIVKLIRPAINWPFQRWQLYRLQWFSAMLVLFGAREDGCFREVAALYSDHYRQVPPYYIVLYQLCTIMLWISCTLVVLLLYASCNWMILFHHLTLCWTTY